MGRSIIGNMIDEKLLGRITANPEIFGGKPIIRGMRISVEMILSLLAQGEKEETILADYPDLEVDDCLDSLAGQPAVGHEMRFISLDLTNTCWTRCIYTPEGTALVMWQANDLEADTNEPVLRAICASLEVDED